MAESEQPRGRIHSYETMGALDGPGLRIVVFMQGCPLRCRYCHNPDTWDFSCGELVSVEEVMGRIRRIRPYFRKHGGVTFSGGEPLAQPDFLAALLAQCKQEGIHTALDISGGIWNDKVPALLDAADLIILDVKSANEKGWEGVTGFPRFQSLLSIIAHLRNSHRPVWVRQVVAKGLNDRPEDMEQLQKLAEGMTVERLELLPYHEMGRSKWEAMGLEYAAADLQPPDPNKTYKTNKK